MARRQFDYRLDVTLLLISIKEIRIVRLEKRWISPLIDPDNTSVVA